MAWIFFIWYDRLVSSLLYVTLTRSRGEVIGNSCNTLPLKSVRNLVTHACNQSNPRFNKCDNTPMRWLNYRYKETHLTSGNDYHRTEN